MTSAHWRSTRRVIVASCAVLLTSPAVARAQIDDPLGELRACARIQATADRIACYEALGQRALQDEAAASAAEDVATPVEPNEAPAEVHAAESHAPSEPVKPAETQVATTTTLGKMTDDMGGPLFEKRAGKPTHTVSGVVTSCKKNAHGKFYFYFDNGQVWKHSGTARLRFRECQFNVTITRDFAGYVMLVEGKKRRVRISRVD